KTSPESARADAPRCSSISAAWAACAPPAWTKSPGSKASATRWPNGFTPHCTAWTPPRRAIRDPRRTHEAHSSDMADPAAHAVDPGHGGDVLHALAVEQLRHRRRVRPGGP